MDVHGNIAGSGVGLSETLILLSLSPYVSAMRVLVFAASEAGPGVNLSMFVCECLDVMLGADSDD